MTRIYVTPNNRWQNDAGEVDKLELPMIPRTTLPMKITQISISANIVSVVVHSSCAKAAFSAVFDALPIFPIGSM